MNRPGTNFTRIWLFAVAGALAALVGCGQAPTAPSVVNETKGPPVLVIAADGSVSFKQAQAIVPEGSDLEAGSASLRVTKQVDGTRGGWLKCGRFFLAVMPGAFDTLGTITMSMKDSTAMLVDLEITPARLNDFKAPVVLAANTTGVDVPADSLCLYWLDDKGKSWASMTSERTMDGANQCVHDVDNSEYSSANTETASTGLWTTLQHFSVYTAGKAGW